MSGIWDLACQRERFSAIYIATQTHKAPPMTNLLLYYAVLAVFAANISLVFYVADFMTPKADAADAARSPIAGNENGPASVKLAA